MYFYGGGMPELAEGSIGDLLVPSSAFVNPYDRLRCEQQGREKLLPEGATVMFRMRQALRGEKRVGWHEDLETSPPFQGVFVEVTLKKALYLVLRGTKPARLERVQCFIPTLEVTAKSLNHAYRLISEAFEPARMSHSGNVFQEVFVARGSGWVELDTLRSAVEAKYEHRLHPGGAAQEPLFEGGK